MSVSSAKGLAMRRTVAVVAAAILSVPALWAQRQGTDWRDYLGGPDSAHYSPLKQLDRGNVGKLQIAWTFPSQDNTAYTFNPLVVGNVAYVIGKGGSLVALDAAAGKELWTHTFERPGAGGARGGAPGQGPVGAAGPAGGFGRGGINQRGLNYWESKDRSDRRIILPVFNQLQEVNARTGKLISPSGITATWIYGWEPAAIRRPSAPFNHAARGESSKTSSSSVPRLARATCRLRVSCAPTTS